MRSTASHMARGKHRQRRDVKKKKSLEVRWKPATGSVTAEPLRRAGAIPLAPRETRTLPRKKKIKKNPPSDSERDG